jgi:periplasmic divalent cation tolerance protein
MADIPDIPRFFVVLSTVPSESVGRDIAREMVAGKLAACVNIVPGVVSIYDWQGRIEESTEALLIMKTTTEKVKSLIENVKRLHPYEVPEIIAIPIDDGYAPYFEWIQSIVGSANKEVSTE